MKKYLFAALGAGLLMTSCQSDEPFAPGNGTAQQVAFTVSLPDAVSTRAGGTNSAAGGVSNNVGANVTFNVALYLDGRLVFADNQLVSSTGNHTSATFKPTLVIGENYQLVAFAEFDNDASATGKGETPETNMGLIDMESGINNEKNDEYFVSTTLTAAPELSATLKRPYGKLRLIAEDLAEAERQFGAKVESVEVTYKHTRPTNFNVIAGTFDPAYTEGAQTFAAAYGEYSNETDAARTIFVDYLPGKYDGSESMVPFTVTVKFEGGKTYTRDFRQDIPVKRNHLTTLKGRLFTIDSDLTLTIEEAFDGETESNFATDLEWVAANGGTVTLTEDITLTKALNITKDMVINLNGHTISAANAKGDGAVIEVAEGVSAKLMGGTIKNTTDNGDAAINSVGNLVLNGVHVEGAPLADGGHPEYAVYANGGTLVVEEGTKIESYRGAIRLANGADVTINGGEVKTTLSSGLTSHVVYAYGSNSKLTINNGEFTMNFAPANDSGASVICPAGATIDIYGGNFEFTGPKGQGGVFQNYMGYGAPVNVYGGVYNDATVNKNLAAGYKTIFADNLYYVLPEAIADAAETAGVTTVTESTADVSAAISGGDAALFMWNDVAYVAETGKVSILASEEGKTTVRGIVESTALTSATVAEGIEVVGNRTFRKCGELTTVALPNTLTEIGPAVFQSCSKLANVTIPATVKTIGEGAFAECTSLTSINIPDGVTRLEKEVLRTTGLTSIEIPASVTYFGTFAFRDCKQLKEVVINAPEFTTEANAFGVMAGALPGTVIYVVNAEMKAYLESTLTYKSQFVVKLISEKQ